MKEVIQTLEFTEKRNMSIGLNKPLNLLDSIMVLILSCVLQFLTGGYFAVVRSPLLSAFIAQ